MLCTLFYLPIKKERENSFLVPKEGMVGLGQSRLEREKNVKPASQIISYIFIDML